MLNEGRRDCLKLSLSRSLSEPGVSADRQVSGGGSSLASNYLSSHQIFSMPSSPCSESVTIQRSILYRKAKVLEAADVARRLTKSQKNKSFLILDLRSFVSYNLRHLRGAINLNCSDRINRRRLQQRRATVIDLVGSHSGRDILKKKCTKEVIVYDDSTRDLETLPPQHPVFLVLMALLDESKEPMLLKGGFQSFELAYPELCDDALMRPNTATEQESTAVNSIWNETCSLYSPLATSPSDLLESSIEQAPVTEILPFLFLGNIKDSSDVRLLKDLGITKVLNVTSHEPPHDASHFLYMNLPALDSGLQNLRQYFDEAIRFIDEGRQSETGVLVHCHAGVSRSPTIVLAYLMKHTRMTMLDAYKLVKSRRPIISPNLNFMGQLVEWESILQADKDDSDYMSCHQGQWQKQESKKVPNTCQV